MAEENNYLNIEKICEKLFKENDFKIIYEVSNNGYVESLTKNLEKYLKEIKNISITYSFIDSDIIHNIENLNKTLLDVITKYLKGITGEAYLDFKTGMDSLIFVAGNFRKKLKINHTQSFYRVRISENEINKRDELFHIPFNKRELVNTQRYSIAGVPTLYLGSSVYCCWLEMGKPSLSQMHISRFQNVQELDILDFTINYNNFIPNNHDNFNSDFNKGNEELFLSYLLMYPLIMACSYIKQFDGKSFIVEYIIPNLLLQWVRNEKSNVDAIQYYSTKKEISEHTKNLVLPPKFFDKKYCSNLVNKFVLTQPTSWQLLDIIDENLDKEYSNRVRNVTNIQDLIIKNYRCTKFYSFEKFLEKFELKKIDLN
ncbi:MAG: hypothetical protein RBT22_12540 [Aliarcobacter sp.]|nr:hypothetical protein [Aliarcobacter sp.]